MASINKYQRAQELLAAEVAEAVRGDMDTKHTEGWCAALAEKLLRRGVRFYPRVIGEECWQIVRRQKKIYTGNQTRICAESFVVRICHVNAKNMEKVCDGWGEAFFEFREEAEQAAERMQEVKAAKRRPGRPVGSGKRQKEVGA